jgi:hypothetical protein
MLAFSSDWIYTKLSSPRQWSTSAQYLQTWQTHLQLQATLKKTFANLGRATVRENNNKRRLHISPAPIERIQKLEKNSSRIYCFYEYPQYLLQRDDVL